MNHPLGRGRNEFRMCRNLPSQSAVLCLCLIRHSFHDITTNWRRRRPKIHAKSIRFYVQECNALMVPRELPYIVGISVLLALSLSMMVPVVIYNDNVFQKRPWLLYLLSGIMAFSIEVNWKWICLCRCRATLLPTPSVECDHVTGTSCPPASSPCDMISRP